MAEQNPVRIRVDHERCAGHGMCAAIAPTVYRLSGTGHNEMGEFTVPADLRRDAVRGAGCCPEEAITVHTPA